MNGEFDLRSFVIGCLSVFLVVQSSAAGQTKGISVDSFRIIEQRFDYVDIELTGVNDGSLGKLCLDAHVKSEDSLVHSAGYAPTIIPVGQKLTFPVRVFRPNGHEEQHTDYLFIMVYPCDKKPVLTFKWVWKYDWPVKPGDVVSPDFEEQASNDSTSTAPWWLITQNLEQEDFSALDNLLKKWNDPTQRDIYGEWKLSSFLSVFFGSAGQGGKWKESLERIQKWRKFNPESTGAAVAEAAYWISYAWNIRGGERISNTDPVAVKLFTERMKRAERALKKSKKYASDSPLWYEAYMLIALHTERDLRSTERLFEEAIHLHPRFEPLYLVMANYWSPINGRQADWQKVDEVVRNAVALTSVTEGVSNYARVYKSISVRQGLEFELFLDSYALWSKMRDSFDELIKRYPSLENINEFASYACQAEDKDTYLRLRAQIQAHIMPKMWRSNYSPDMCDHKYMLYS